MSKRKFRPPIPNNISTSGNYHFELKVLKNSSGKPMLEFSTVRMVQCYPLEPMKNFRVPIEKRQVNGVNLYSLNFEKCQDSSGNNYFERVLSVRPKRLSVLSELGREISLNLQEILDFRPELLGKKFRKIINNNNNGVNGHKDTNTSLRRGNERGYKGHARVGNRRNLRDREY